MIVDDYCWKKKIIFFFPFGLISATVEKLTKNQYKLLLNLKFVFADLTTDEYRGTGQQH